LVTNHGEVYGGIIDIALDRTITGITHVPDLTQVTIDLDGIKMDNINLKVFKGLALAGISLDFWNVNTRCISFTVKDSEAEKTKQILENIGIIPRLQSGCAKVAAVGAGMTGVPGVMARVVEAITAAEVQILQSSDSHTTIWVLVQNKDMKKAVVALHQQFGFGNKK
jgi:aspartate kinase